MRTEDIENLFLYGTVPDKNNLRLDLSALTGRLSGSQWRDSSPQGAHGTITGATLSAEAPSKEPRVLDGNLVYNGDFRIRPYTVAAQTTSGTWWNGTATGTATQPPFGWYFVNRINTGTFEAGYDSAKNAFKITTTVDNSSWPVIRLIPKGGTGWALYPQYIRVKPSTEYKLSCEIETDNAVSATSGVNVNVTEVTSAGAGITGTDVSATNITGTTSKKLYERTFTTRANCLYVDILAGMKDTTGTAYFSDIRLTEV